MKRGRWAGALALGGLGACSPETASVVTEMPLSGEFSALGVAAERSVRLAVDDQDGEACGGRWALDARGSDHADGSGSFDPGLAERNAEDLADDESVAAVVGTLNSGAAMVVIPVLNEVGIPMVSPSNTYAGLTQEIGADEGEPEIYYPSGDRNYARVVGGDHLQGRAAAKWGADLGASSAFVFHTEDPYASGLADALEAAAPDYTVTISDREVLSAESDFAAAAAAVVAADADLVYFGGFDVDVAAPLFEALDTAGFAGITMGADGLLDPAFAEAAGDSAEGLYLTAPGILPEELTGADAAAWASAYEDAYDEPPPFYAAESYAAAQVILAAFESVCDDGDALTDHDAVRRAVMGTSGVPTILGEVTFDANGDITTPIFSGMRMVAGEAAFSTLIEL